MILSGIAIKKAVYEGKVGIVPYSEDQVEAAHINLHLGGSSDMENGILVVKAGAFVLASTLERVALPSELCGLLEGDRSLLSKGYL